MTQKRAKTRISLIIPVLNEGKTLKGFLDRLQNYRSRGHEIILVDGGSDDGSLALGDGLVDRQLHSAPGRARQMNRGAAEAAGQVLLFLHADSELPGGADHLINQGLADSGRGWGWFDTRLDSRAPAYRLIGRMMSLRARLTRVATGDQALFVRRPLFESLGGFPEIPLMEDIAISKRLRRTGKPWVLAPCVVTSSRHWQRRGLLRTVWLMWSLRLQYFLGVPPERLHRRYYPGRRL